MSWQLLVLHAQHTQHVLPVADSLPHQQDGFCFCEPQYEVDCQGWLTWVHNSHDGREEFERPLFPEFKLKVKRSH